MWANRDDDDKNLGKRPRFFFFDFKDMSGKGTITISGGNDFLPTGNVFGSPRQLRNAASFRPRCPCSQSSPSISFSFFSLFFHRVSHCDRKGSKCPEFPFFRWSWCENGSNFKSSRLSLESERTSWQSAEAIRQGKGYEEEGLEFSFLIFFPLPLSAFVITAPLNSRLVLASNPRRKAGVGWHVVHAWRQKQLLCYPRLLYQCALYLQKKNLKK